MATLSVFLKRRPGPVLPVREAFLILVPQAVFLVDRLERAVLHAIADGRVNFVEHRPALGRLPRVQHIKTRFHGLADEFQLRRLAGEVRGRGAVLHGRGEPLVFYEADDGGHVFVDLQVDLRAVAVFEVVVGNRPAEDADGLPGPAVFGGEVAPAVDGVVIFVGEELQAVDVIRPARGVILREVFAEFVTVHDHVNPGRVAHGLIEKLRELVPRPFDEFTFQAESFGEVLGEIHFEADELARVVLINERGPARGVRAPAEGRTLRILGIRWVCRRQSDERQKGESAERRIQRRGTSESRSRRGNRT